MTVSTTKASDVFLGNDVATGFSCEWRIFNDTDVLVSLVNQTTGVDTPLVLNTDYTIGGAGDQAGFTVATVTPVASGTSLYVRRALAYTQPTDFTNQGAFFPIMHEDAMDRLEMQIQQQTDDLGRALKSNAVTGNYEASGKAITNAAAAVAGVDVPTLDQVSQLVTGAASGLPPSGIATYTDLASTASGKGSSLLGFQQQGTGSVASNIKAVLLGFFFTPQMFGAKGDDTTDDTAAVQNWVNACGTYGYRGYVPAVASGYKLTAPIVVNTGMQIVGDGVEPNIGTLVTTGVNTRGRGSWFHIAHAGVGFSYPGGSARSGCLVQGIGTYRNQPTPNGAAYTPAANDYDFNINAVDITFRDVMLLNPTKGISQTGAGYGRLTLENVRGQPLSIGINVDGSYDAGRVRGVHWWPFWTNDPGVRAYQLANAKAFQIARWDNPDISSCFCIGFAYTFYVLQSANGTLNKAVITNCDGDNGGWFLFVDSTVTGGATIHMSNCRTQGNTGGVPPANACNIQINGNNTRLVLSNVELRYPQSSCVRVQGSGNKVKMSNMTLGAWNQVNGTYRAVDAATTGNNVQLNDTPLISESPVGATLAYNETAGSTVSAPIGSGVTTGTTTAGGYLTISHGGASTPRRALASVIGGNNYLVHPTGSYTATTFDVQLRDSTTGAAVVSTSVTVAWRVDF